MFFLLNWRYECILNFKMWWIINIQFNLAYCWIDCKNKIVEYFDKKKKQLLNCDVKCQQNIFYKPCISWTIPGKCMSNIPIFYFSVIALSIVTCTCYIWCNYLTIIIAFKLIDYSLNPAKTFLKKKKFDSTIYKYVNI